MILGIDPGLSGALAVYDPSRNLIVNAHTVPTLELKRNHKTKRSVNIHSTVAIARELAQTYPGLTAYIELVGSTGKEGGPAMFSFGRTDGTLETAVVAANIPVTKVPPQVWKKALGCTADKDQTLLRASQLMPTSAHEWTPVRNVRDKEACKGIAEAALIAYYGATKNLP